jgi:hypothetical protein
MPVFRRIARRPLGAWAPKFSKFKPSHLPVWAFYDARPFAVRQCFWAGALSIPIE